MLGGGGRIQSQGMPRGDNAHAEDSWMHLAWGDPWECRGPRSSANAPFPKPWESEWTSGENPRGVQPEGREGRRKCSDCAAAIHDKMIDGGCNRRRSSCTNGSCMT